MVEYKDENRVYLTGRLTQDPILRYTKTKLPVLRFTLAVNYFLKEDIKETLFIPAVVVGELALEVSSFLKKGTPIKIEGRLRNRTVKLSDEEEHKVIEVFVNKIEIFTKKEE